MKIYRLKRHIHAQIDSDVAVTVGPGSLVRGDNAGPNHVRVEIPITSSATFPCRANVSLLVTVPNYNVDEFPSASPVPRGHQPENTVDQSNSPDNVEAEHRSLLEDIFPVGQERWIKVKYTDFDWCVKNLRLQDKHKPEDAVNLGFDVMALGVRDEYVPQVNALMDVRDDVVSMLANREAEPIFIDNIRVVFQQKIAEIKKRTIVEDI